MSKTVEDRREYGKAHLGNVFVHHFANETEDRFEVRAGNHTIDVKGSLAEAEVIANALVGNKPAAQTAKRK
jgi:hypothetical protein